MRELAIMRVIDREMAKTVAGFRSTTRANTRLLKLTRAGLLNRFFIGSVAAGRKAIYTLSPAGGAVSGADFRRISRSRGKTLVGDLYIDHQMRISEIYIALKHRALPDGVRFLRWINFHEPLGDQQKLVPDGYSELAAREQLMPMFLEVDLGHQSMRIWEQKVRAYLRLAISGDFTRQFRQPRFRTLVITTSPRRLSNIRAVIAKQTDKLFWLSDFQSLNRAGLWSPIWYRPSGDHALPLI